MVEYHKIWYIMIICNPDLSYLYWRFLASQAMYSYINHPLRLNNHQSINYSINSILLQSYYPSPNLKHYQLGSWFEFGFSLMYFLLCYLYRIQYPFCSIVDRYSIQSNCFSCISASLRRLDDQPEWLKGGKLRDYQLEGLNFLVNGYVRIVIHMCTMKALCLPPASSLMIGETDGEMTLMLYLLMRWAWEKQFKPFPCLASFM
jgi:hypothetical protein